MPVEMSPRTEQIVDAALLAGLLVAAAGALVRGRKRGVTRDGAYAAAATLAAALIAWGVRGFLCKPSFITPNLGGPDFVDQILIFPEPAHGAGHVGFVLLGAIVRALRGTFSTVARIDGALGAATLALAGWGAARWSGRSWAAPLAVLLGAFQPALVRVAASEDPRNLAVLLGWIALLAIDVYGERRDLWALAAALFATLLMIYTREPPLTWALFVLAIGLARGGRALLKRAEFLVAASLILIALVARARTGGVAGIDVGLAAVVYTSPRALWAALIHHPLLDVVHFAALLLPLTIYGAKLLPRRARRLLIASFAITLPLALPVPGIELSGRLPTLTLALAAAAVAAEKLAARRGPFIPLVACAALSPLVLPGRHILEQVPPLYREYEHVREAARALPSPLQLVDRPMASDAPDWRLSDRVFADKQVTARLDVSHLSYRDFNGTPIYFLQGVACRGRSVGELVSGGGQRELTFGELRDFVIAPLERRVFADVAAPNEIRPECQRLLDTATPEGPELSIRDARDENPFVLYGDAPIAVRFVRLTGLPK